MESNSVATLVYKYNPKTLWVLGIYSLCFFGFVFRFFRMSGEEILLFATILIATPLYARYGGNSKVKLRTWDENRLIFSSAGIDFGDSHYSVEALETAMIYLEAFTGFEYREIGPDSKNRYVYVRADGDRNKISFRYQNEVMDFTFCLASYAQFCMFRAVINDWVAAGVNVGLRQVFEDDFIISEMAYYHTETGFL